MTGPSPLTRGLDDSRHGPVQPAARGPWATMWHRHPAVRAPGQLTVGERAADYMRNGMGSWAFVFGASVFLAAWISITVVGGAAHHAFDAYPFIFLNLLLSCLAAMQGAILLNAAKRADQVTSELAAHDYAVNRRTEKLIEENTELTRVSPGNSMPTTTASRLEREERARCDDDGAAAPAEAAAVRHRASADAFLRFIRLADIAEVRDGDVSFPLGVLWPYSADLRRVRAAYDASGGDASDSLLAAIKALLDRVAFAPGSVGRDLADVYSGVHAALHHGAQR